MRIREQSQMVKNLPSVQWTWVLSLGWENALEKRMATQSSILAWRNPWTEETGRSVESQSWTQLSDEHFHFHELTTDLNWN